MKDKNFLFKNYSTNDIYILKRDNSSIIEPNKFYEFKLGDYKFSGYIKEDIRKIKY